MGAGINSEGVRPDPKTISRSGVITYSGMRGISPQDISSADKSPNLLFLSGECFNAFRARSPRRRIGCYGGTRELVNLLELYIQRSVNDLNMY